MLYENEHARSVSMRRVLPAAFSLLLFAVGPKADAQTDPGFRASTPLAGGAIAGLTPDQVALFNQAKTAFQEVDGVADGLGPRFNADSCATCHIFPALGGS